MKIYLLIDHADYYEAKVVAVFTSESRALEYGEKYAKKNRLCKGDWWVDDYEVDPIWEPGEEEEEPSQPTEEDMYVTAVLDKMMPDIYNQVVASKPILETFHTGNKGIDEMLRPDGCCTWRVRNLEEAE